MSANFAALTRSALIGELEQLRDEIVKTIKPISDSELWQRPIEPGNSIGHLILHLTGNLNHFVGASLGNSGYVREREREFTETNPPERKVLLSNLSDAVFTFRRIVESLSLDTLTAAHPDGRFGTVIQTLIHLVAHFALHRGQISYLARMVHR